MSDLRNIFLHDFYYLWQGSWLTLHFLLLAPLFNELLVLLELGPHLLVLECQLLLGGGDRLFDLLLLITLLFISYFLCGRNRGVLLSRKASIIDEVEGRLVVCEDGVAHQAVLWDVPDLGRAHIGTSF